jgi:hypothetical protein
MIETLPKKISEEDSENTELLMYDANAMVYILTNALKEQQAQIEVLKKELEEMKSKMNY